jgi:ribose-phosphate pyrophosphokinase
MIQIKESNGTKWTIPFDAYPDGIPIAKVGLGSSPVAMLLQWESVAEFVLGLSWIHAMKERNLIGCDFRLAIPFFPGARQDRLNTHGDVLFSAKYFAGMVNALNLASVTVVDPHSEVTPALIDRCHTIKASMCIGADVLDRGYGAVVSPDAGAEKRASQVAKKLNVPLLHAWKTRDLKTGEITGFGMEGASGIIGPSVLVVDDICDGGGTFVGLADVMKEQGLTADLWVTHGLFTAGTVELLKRYQCIFTTDSNRKISSHGNLFVNNFCQSLL